MNSFLWKAVGLDPVAEYQFAPPRKWRFDWAFPDLRIAVEQEGGVWIQGRHSRGSGFVKDLEKYNSAATIGWRIFRFQPRDFIKGTAQSYVAEAILNLKVSGHLPK